MSQELDSHLKARQSDLHVKEAPDRPEQTTVQTAASVQSKNCLNYTVCYTSIKNTLQAA